MRPLMPLLMFSLLPRSPCLGVLFWFVHCFSQNAFRFYHWFLCCSLFLRLAVECCSCLYTTMLLVVSLFFFLFRFSLLLLFPFSFWTNNHGYSHNHNYRYNYSYNYNYTTLHHTTVDYTTFFFATLQYKTLQYTTLTLHYTTLITPHHNYNCNCDHNYTTLITFHYRYNSTILRCITATMLQVQLPYTTLHPAIVGEVTSATIATPTAFWSIKGFALPSMHHNHSPLLQCPIFETSALALCGTTGILFICHRISSPRVLLSLSPRLLVSPSPRFLVSVHFILIFILALTLTLTLTPILSLIHVSSHLFPSCVVMAHGSWLMAHGSWLISSHLVSSCLISMYLVSSCLILSDHVSSQCISCQRQRTSLYHISWFRFITFLQAHPIHSHHIISYPISSSHTSFATVFHISRHPASSAHPVKNHYPIVYIALAPPPGLKFSWYRVLRSFFPALSGVVCLPCHALPPVALHPCLPCSLPRDAAFAFFIALMPNAASISSQHVSG